MLTYDVTYYLGDKRLPDLDSNVSENYLAGIPRSLKAGETAYARCLNNPHEDRRIDKHGVHDPV